MLSRRPSTRALALFVALAGAPARADEGVGSDEEEETEGEEIPRLPAPFVLPDLTHPGADVALDGFVARFAPDGARTGAVATITRVSAEASVLVPRRTFVGFSYPFAIALPPDGGLAPGEPGLASGRRALPGNVEVHARAVFPLPSSLAIGFSFGLVAPTATFDRAERANRSAALAAASLDPSNVGHFLPGRIGLRPAGDLRIVRGPLVFQGRHGMDVLFDVFGGERTKVAGRLLGHLGLLLDTDVEISVEASQIYFFTSDAKVEGEASAFEDRYRVRDGRRTSLVIGPGIRLSTRDVDVGASIVTNLVDPLTPASGGFVALHLSLVGRDVVPRSGDGP